MDNFNDKNNLPDIEEENVSTQEENIPVQKQEKDDSVKMELYDWVQCFVSALVIGILIFVFVLRVITVDGSSMNPTLYHQDKIIISNLFYEPEYGDIIVLKAPNYGEGALVKRVIATEGQTVDIDFDEGIVYVDGKALNEPYTASPTYDREEFYGEVTVPEGCVFVMGDNRNASTDSRTNSIGMIDERNIMGKVYVIIFPGVDRLGKHDFSRIGSVY